LHSIYIPELRSTLTIALCLCVKSLTFIGGGSYWVGRGPTFSRPVARLFGGGSSAPSLPFPFPLSFSSPFPPLPCPALPPLPSPPLITGRNASAPSLPPFPSLFLPVSLSSPSLPLPCPSSPSPSPDNG